MAVLNPNDELLKEWMANLVKEVTPDVSAEEIRKTCPMLSQPEEVLQVINYEFKQTMTKHLMRLCEQFNVSRKLEELEKIEGQNSNQKNW